MFLYFLQLNACGGEVLDNDSNPGGVLLGHYSVIDRADNSLIDDFGPVTRYSIRVM